MSRYKYSKSNLTWLKGFDTLLGFVLILVLGPSGMSSSRPKRKNKRRVRVKWRNKGISKSEKIFTSRSPSNIHTLLWSGKHSIKERGSKILGFCDRVFYKCWYLLQKISEPKTKHEFSFVLTWWTSYSSFKCFGNLPPIHRSGSQCSTPILQPVD